MNRAEESTSDSCRVNSFVHIHQIMDVAFMNLGNADRVVRFGVSRAT